MRKSNTRRVKSKKPTVHPFESRHRTPEEKAEALAEHKRRVFGEQMRMLAMDEELCGRIKAFIVVVSDKTPEQICTEAARLEGCRRTIRDSEAHDRIAAQMHVLTERMDLDELRNQFEDGNGDVMDAALDAWRWAAGELWERYDPFPPSSMWAAYIEREQIHRAA